MLVFGVLGFVLREMKYPMAPLVLGLVLGDSWTESSAAAWCSRDGSLVPFFTRADRGGDRVRLRSS